MKDVTEKMEKIAGKGDATMGKPEYLRKEKQAAKENDQNQRMWQDIVSDFRQDAKTANKRMFIIIIALLVALVASNFYWLYTFSLYDYETTTTTTTVSGEQEGDGVNIMAGGGVSDVAAGDNSNDDNPENTEAEGRPIIGDDSAPNGTE